MLIVHFSIRMLREFVRYFVSHRKSHDDEKKNNKLTPKWTVSRSSSDWHWATQVLETISHKCALARSFFLLLSCSVRCVLCVGQLSRCYIVNIMRRICLVGVVSVFVSCAPRNSRTFGACRRRYALNSFLSLHAVHFEKSENISSFWKDFMESEPTLKWFHVLVAVEQNLNIFGSASVVSAPEFRKIHTNPCLAPFLFCCFLFFELIASHFSPSLSFHSYL